MFDFDAMATFVEVVQLGSFSAAAKALRLPRSTVSQRVARLEASLGVRLLERTTRVVRPDDGSSLIAQRLKGGDLWLCATPSYLEGRGRPKSPADLDEHACIVYGESRVTRWTFERGREVRRIDVRGALSMNSFVMLHEAVRAGAGIAPVPSILCAEDVRRGRLVRVLADWSIDRKDLRVVYPSNRHLSPRVRLFAGPQRGDGAVHRQESHGAQIDARGRLPVDATWPRRRDPARTPEEAEGRSEESGGPGSPRAVTIS
ncbi:LysR family transcriptional regulator [Sorangium sp. So ce363]|uniref:LysR family transcriptional regulator n=1 Tax=Sorangium sp. So ce363 TaxID=3133304 RepID=UPI003F62B047